MLARRLRRRPNINPALDQYIVFAGHVFYSVFRPCIRVSNEYHDMISLRDQDCSACEPCTCQSPAHFTMFTDHPTTAAILTMKSSS